MWAKKMIAFLDDVSAAPEDVRSCLEALDEHGLGPFNYHYYYLNLLSVFGDAKPPAEIRALAIACVRFRLWRQWESHVDAAELHKKKLAAEELPVRLKGWNKEYLDSILAQGRGVIICTCHYGPSSYILDDLATFGYDLAIGLDSNSAYGFRNRFRLLDEMYAGGAKGEDPIPVGNGTVRIIDVENNGLATVLLAKALRKNEIVILYFDGNCGFDSARGSSNKSTLKCLGYPVNVKSGVTQLAVNAKAPLLPIFAIKTQGLLSPGERGVACNTQAIFPEAMIDGGQESFAQESLQSLFRRMEDLVRADPEQWEGACLFHRWRTPAAEPVDGAETGRGLDRVNDLAKGRRLRINARIIVSIPSGEGFMLVNVRTLQVFKINRRHDWLLSALARQGIDRNMLPDPNHDSDGYEAAMSCVKSLSDLGFIERCE